MAVWETRGVNQPFIMLGGGLPFLGDGSHILRRSEAAEQCVCALLKHRMSAAGARALSQCLLLGAGSFAYFIMRVSFSLEILTCFRVH